MDSITELPPVAESTITFIRHDDFKIGKTYVISDPNGIYYITRQHEGYRIEYPDQYIINKAKKVKEFNSRK